MSAVNELYDEVDNVYQPICEQAQDHIHHDECILTIGYSVLVEKFLKDNGLQTLIRSHEVCSAGYEKHHGGKTITIFSASNYGGTDDNEACHLVIQPNLQIVYQQHSVLRTGGPGILKTAKAQSCV